MANQPLSPSGEITAPAANQVARQPADLISRRDHFIIVASTIVLIGTEIWLTGAAAFWAVHGLLGLPLWADMIFAAFLVVPALWSSYHLVRLAVFSEAQQ